MAAVSPPSEQHVSQAAHAHEPVWKQAEMLGYHVCGINGCVLSDRHVGACLFPELSGRRRSRGAAETHFSPAAGSAASNVQLQPKRCRLTPPLTPLAAAAEGRSSSAPPAARAPPASAKQRGKARAGKAAPAKAAAKAAPAPAPAPAAAAAAPAPAAAAAAAADSSDDAVELESETGEGEEEAEGDDAGDPSPPPPRSALAAAPPRLKPARYLGATPSPRTHP